MVLASLLSREVKKSSGLDQLELSLELDEGEGEAGEEESQLQGILQLLVVWLQELLW